MHIVLIGGSLREASLNRRLLDHLARELRESGHETQDFQGEALRLPLYQEDLEVPAGVESMAQALRSCQGVVFVSPEYNAGIPGHLKNVLDWLSVQRPSPWTGLPCLLAAASPGAFGGSRGLLPWRATLANLGCWVAPVAITIPGADRRLGPDGTPLEDRSRQEVQRSLQAFLQGASRLAVG